MLSRRPVFQALLSLDAWLLSDANADPVSTTRAIQGTALWAVDYLFSMSAVNVSMMNFHGGGEGPYTAIGYNSTSSQVGGNRRILTAHVTRHAQMCPLHPQGP